MFFSRRRVAETSQEAADTPCYLRTHQVTVTVDLPDGGNQRILDSVTVHLEAPRTAVLGLNGSGKSTFLGLFNGLVHPSEGTVEVNGVDALAHPHKARQQVGMIFSDPAAQLIMPTVREDIELSLRRNPALTRKQRLHKAHELLTQRGIEDKQDQSVFSLSGGEKQLVALTSVLATDPRVLLLDEPTTLLDLRNRLNLMRHFNTLNQMLVISTHDLDLAAACDEAIILHEGRLMAHGAAADTVRTYRNWCSHGFPHEHTRGGAADTLGSDDE